MIAPDILALDFDGVCCDGMREYFETSRRTHAEVWPAEPMPAADHLEAFATLRPVILSGWEMPVLLRAITQGRSPAEILGDLTGWLGLHAPYGSLEELRRLVAEPAQAVLVTTKEGEFARLILDRWEVRLADVQGKETGVHKCLNLRGLIAGWVGAHGRRPRLAFIEDRLETLQHVTTHPDLDDVALFLAAWGYNTEATRATAAADPRIRLLTLEQFRAGTVAWP